MWFVLTSPIINPENQEELHPVGHCMTMDRMRALEKNYGVDSLDGRIIMTGEAYDRIMGQGVYAKRPAQ